MADSANQQQPQPEPGFIRKPVGVYKGNPANQRNHRAKNAWEPKPNRPEQHKPERLTPANAPKTLPKPTRLHDTSHVKMTETSPAEGSVFSTGMSVREVVPRLTFTPSAPALVDITRQTYSELVTDEPNLSKVLLPEYLDYYATAMLWLRIASLKQKNSQALTLEEQDLLTLVQHTPFVTPEPITLQLRQLGNVVSQTKQHLYPSFPTLPVHILGGVGGYYGPIAPPAAGVDDTVHNLYEEIPCLGVLATAVRAAISNALPGVYPSPLTYDGLQPNRNLLGFRPLGSRRQEPKNLAFDNGINEQDFPSYPPNTGFSFSFVTAISNILSNTKTFKNTEILFSTLNEIGAQSQLVISRPLDTPGTNNLRGEQLVTSLGSESISVYGSAIFFDSQLVKEPSQDGDDTTWVLFDPTPDIIVPPEWIANRNDRRNLPIQYMQRVFTSISQQAASFRINTVKTLVLTKR